MKDINESQKSKIAGMSGTIIFHALLFVCLLLTGLTTRVPYPDSGGIEVALGSPEEGGPDNIPTSSSEDLPTNVPPANSSPDDLIETGDDPDAPATEPDKDPKEIVEDPNKTDKPIKTDNNTKTDGDKKDKVEEKKADPRFSYPGKKSDGQGKGEKPGNGGKEDGDWDGDPDGTGKGDEGKGPETGPKGSEDLRVPGRSLIEKPILKSDVQEEERVGVEVTVDARGNVFSAKAVFAKSTTTDKKLWKEAENLAKKIKYSSSTDGKSTTSIIVIRFRPQ